MRLLFDAGITGACAERRLAEHGREIRDVDALIVSHDHVDHIRAAGVFHRKFGMPLYMTRRTMINTWCNLGRLADLRHFLSGDTLEFGAVRVHTIPTAHDAADGVAFVIEFEGRSLGILTDLGHATPSILEVAESVDAAYVETNFDPEMLEVGPYPPPLKERVRGDAGHLSNFEAAQLLRSCRKVPDWVACAHLSEKNNTVELAVDTVTGAVGESYPVRVASRYEVSPLWEV